MRIMTIQPITNNNNKILKKNNTQSTLKPNNCLSGFYYPPAFKSLNIIDMQFQELNNLMSDFLLPYKEKYTDKYVQTAKIGCDMQEKTELINEFEKSLFNKKIIPPDNTAYKEMSEKAHTYDKYIQNSESFEYLTQTADANGFLSKDAKKYAEISRPKMSENYAEFEKLKPARDTFYRIDNQMNEDLDKTNIKNHGVFYNSVQNLNDKYLKSVYLLISSGIPAIADIQKNIKSLDKDYHAGRISYYQTQERLSTLCIKALELKEKLPELEQNIPEMDKFINENKDYQTSYPSKENIKDFYEALNTESDNIIKKYTVEMEDYNTISHADISYGTIYKTIDTQNKILIKLTKMINHEKYKD